MPADFFIKKNDTTPAITSTLQDADGNAVNLTGATVKFIMRKKGASSAKVDASATVVTPAEGTVSYTWVTANTDTAGDYEAEWQVTFAGGAVQTFPNSKHLKVSVVRDLG